MKWQNKWKVIQERNLPSENNYPALIWKLIKCWKKECSLNEKEKISLKRNMKVYNITMYWFVSLANKLFRVCVNKKYDTKRKNFHLVEGIKVWRSALAFLLLKF